MKRSPSVFSNYTTRLDDPHSEEVLITDFSGTLWTVQVCYYINKQPVKISPSIVSCTKIDSIPPLGGNFTITEIDRTWEEAQIHFKLLRKNWYYEPTPLMDLCINHNEYVLVDSVTIEKGKNNVVIITDSTLIGEKTDDYVPLSGVMTMEDLVASYVFELTTNCCNYCIK
jgi:hypothetical protein